MRIKSISWAAILCLIVALAGCGTEPLPEEATESFLDTRLYAILPDPAAFFGVEAETVGAAEENGRIAAFCVTEQAARAYAELLQQPDWELYLYEQYSFIGTEKEEEFWRFDYVGEHEFSPVTVYYPPAGEQPFSAAVFLHLLKEEGDTTFTLICSEDLAVIDLGHRAE